MEFQAETVALADFHQPLFVEKPPHECGVELTGILPVRLDTGGVSRGILFDVRFFQPMFRRVKVQHLFRRDGNFQVVHPDLVGLVFQHVVELEPLNSHEGKFSRRVRERK